MSHFHRCISGSLTDYPDYQDFEVKIFAGSKYAKILTPDSTGPYFESIRQEFSLVAADSIDSSVVTVGIKVEPVEDYATSVVPGGVVPGKKSGIKSVNRLRGKSRLKSTAVISSGGGRKSVSFIEGKYAIAWVKIKKEEGEHSILLGETKYYEALVDKDDATKLDIKEIDDPAKADPGRVDAKFKVQKESGDKLGVYWEYRDKNGKKLPSGLIRLIGRYWQKGMSYQVGLTATTSTATGSIDIDVKKPTRLGNAIDTVQNVFDQKLDLDELIIKYAGENGIPPQLIKGQMEQESSFRPQWRYEPFQDAQRAPTDEIFQNNKFVITETYMGPNFPPPNHSRGVVAPIFYNELAVKISKYLIDNWSMYVATGKTAETPDIILGSESKKTDNLTATWSERWHLLKNRAKNARKLAHNFVKSLISDSSTNLGKKYDRLAQSRIFTSYGFLQLLYVMAITDGKFYKETDGRYEPTDTQYMDKNDDADYPEKLNEEEIFMPRYSDRLLRNLNWLFPRRIPESEWKGQRKVRNAKGEIVKTYSFDGFEDNWKGSLYFYNPQSGYPEEVWSKAQKYLPRQ